MPGTAACLAKNKSNVIIGWNRRCRLCFHISIEQCRDSRGNWLFLLPSQEVTYPCIRPIWNFSFPCPLVSICYRSRGDKEQVCAVTTLITTEKTQVVKPITPATHFCWPKQRAAQAGQWRFSVIKLLIWTGWELLLLEPWCQHTQRWVYPANTSGCGVQQTRLFLYFSHQWGPLSCDTSPKFRFGLQTLWPAADASQS